LKMENKTDIEIAREFARGYQLILSESDHPRLDRDQEGLLVSYSIGTMRNPLQPDDEKRKLLREEVDEDGLENMGLRITNSIYNEGFEKTNEGAVSFYNKNVLKGYNGEFCCRARNFGKKSVRILKKYLEERKLI
jgi:hypothetical protein